MFNVALI
jgi:hypothetical protein